jgi:hypothetical protein
LQAIMIPEKYRTKMLVIGFLSFTRLGFRLYADKSAQFIGNRIGAFVTISRVQ